nr:translation initiation factor IF-2-like [Macaca fascicularis]
MPQAKPENLLPRSFPQRCFQGLSSAHSRTSPETAAPHRRLCGARAGAEPRPTWPGARRGGAEPSRPRLRPAPPLPAGPPSPAGPGGRSQVFVGARMSELWLRSGSGSLRSLRAGLAAHPEPRGAPAALPAARPPGSQPLGLGGPRPSGVADPTALPLPPAALGPLQPRHTPTRFLPQPRGRPGSHPVPSFLRSFRQLAFLERLRRALHRAFPAFRVWPQARWAPPGSLCPLESRSPPPPLCSVRCFAQSRAI